MNIGNQANDIDEEVDDFPQFANQNNKRLNQTVKSHSSEHLQKRLIKAVAKQSDQLEERLKILKDHLKNVEQELIHTQQMVETKTENHMGEIVKRQIGRLESQLRKLNKLSSQHQQRLNQIQTQIFRNTQKFEELRLQLNWNSQQLQQWIIAQGQKEDDNKTLEKYKKDDDARIRQLNLEIQKYTILNGRKQSQLQRQITETQAAQIQLDKTAEEFKKQHQERHELFVQWQKVADNIAKRNEEIYQQGQIIAKLQMQIHNLITGEIKNRKSTAVLNAKQTKKNLQLVAVTINCKTEN